MSGNSSESTAAYNLDNIRVLDLAQQTVLVKLIVAAAQLRKVPLLENYIAPTNHRTDCSIQHASLHTRHAHPFLRHRARTTDPPVDDANSFKMSKSFKPNAGGTAALPSMTQSAFALARVILPSSAGISPRLELCSVPDPAHSACRSEQQRGTHLRDPVLDYSYIDIRGTTVRGRPRSGSVT